MTLFCDSRERLPAIIEGCDGQRLLEYRLDGDGGIFSFDFEATLADGRVLRVERKSLQDAVSSWTDGKLHRQLAAVDLFILEMGVFDVVEPGSVEANFVEKHLQVLRLLAPVWVTTGPADTISQLRWLMARPGGLDVRPNRIEGSGSRENARQGILRAALSGSGHSTSRETPGGTVGAQVERLVDWGALCDALHLESWPNGADWGGRKPSAKALAKIAAGLRGPGVEEPPGQPPLPESPTNTGEQPAAANRDKALGLDEVA